MGVTSHSLHFASQMSHYVSVFVAVARTTLEVVASFARQREVWNLSLPTGFTVAMVDPVENTNGNVLAVVHL